MLFFESRSFEFLCYCWS